MNGHLNSKAGIPHSLITIVGPTGIGKTSLAVRLAKHYDAEIISADSRQFYQEMNIGTAKPDKKELKEVKHHFINNLSIYNKSYNAGRFEQEALEFLSAYYKKKSIAV